MYNKLIHGIYHIYLLSLSNIAINGCFNLYIKVPELLNKQDGVGPIDNKPSAN